MAEIDTKLYDAMGQRFGVVKVLGEGRAVHIITASTQAYHTNTIVATNLKYSEAQAIIKLLGDEDGECE